MDSTLLYGFGAADKRGALSVRAMVTEDVAWSLARGEAKAEAPVPVGVLSGRRPLDLMEGVPVPVRLISDHFLQILKNSGFTGWSTYPVEVFNREAPEHLYEYDFGEVVGAWRGRAEHIPGYHGLAVTGRSGPYVRARSQEVWVPSSRPEGKPRLTTRGLYLEAAEWDGSDLFSPGSSVAIVVVERVKAALEAAGLAPLLFERLSEAERLGAWWGR